MGDRYVLQLIARRLVPQRQFVDRFGRRIERPFRLRRLRCSVIGNKFLKALQAILRRVRQRLLAKHANHVAPFDDRELTVGVGHSGIPPSSFPSSRHGLAKLMPNYRMTRFVNRNMPIRIR